VSAAAGLKAGRRGGLPLSSSAAERLQPGGRVVEITIQAVFAFSKDRILGR
jgi:hypothetical protein